jgi:CheY-like chemotaxis protein
MAGRADRSRTERLPVSAIHARVLVVDDNHDAADSLAAFLRLSDYEVRVAYDGFQAVRAVTESVPDCIVMDYSMPGMDGCEAARRVRALPDARDVVLVSLTAYSDAGSRESIARAGFDHYLNKPAYPKDVTRILETVRGAG